MKKKLTMLLASLFLMLGTVWAQAPQATPTEAITGLLNRIGGDGAANLFEIVIDASLAQDGKDVFVITSQNGKPCIKGNTQLSVATGINWYLNHYAHVNLTWNNLTTDLSQVALPVPTSEEKHVCNTTYRYDFNTCTFSYSMAFWTWDRWQQEIDWMALHGINAPLNLVGLDVVTRNFLKELGVSDADIDAYIAGPGFIAWFAMNNLEGWGGTIESQGTGVFMQGNPDWWYTRQEQLCKNMLQRMRELGMQPVIPGFSGQIPNSLSNYSISGFSSSDVINGGTWAGGYTRPDILHPNSSSYATLAPIYYKHLEAIMGVSELYSMDPFHEGGLPNAVTNATCYPPIMAALDTYHNAVDDAAKTSYNVGTEDNQAKWIIQYWQNIPQSGAFSAMSSYGDRFIGLDLFSDNIYAGNAAKWRDTGNNCYYQGRPYIYCMLHNFGGRSGLHGRLETTMDGYFQALAKGNNCQGIGATPEGTETNPVLYDMLFELPWMDVNNRPTADEWLEDYAYSRYGVQNEKAFEALKDLKKSVWDCKVNQQGTSEAVILARPNWTINSVSSWSTSAIYWDTQDVLQAADKLYSIKDVVTANGGQDGIANYNYDFIDVVRQAMVDYAAELLPLINAARGDDAEYTRLYQLYLQLMLDLDEMLSYDENFKLERWTSLARNIANEVSGTTENDRNWLEWNARTQVTVWSKGNTDLHDYSNRCWAGLIKDFHYKRWKYFFENNGASPNGGWFSGFEYPWTVDFNETYDLAGDYSQIVIPNDMTATEKAAETFGNYFGRVKGATKNYIFPMGVTRKAIKSDVIPEVYRGQTVDLPLEIGKNVTITSVWVDLNNDGAKGNGETLAVTNNQVAIPADAAIGKTTAQVVYSDGTDITFNLALVENISAERTVTAVAGANGSVAIEGADALSITNAKAVKITATANTGYNFENWTDAAGNVVSNDNPYIYYGKEAATFTANFIQNKWGVPTEDKGDWGNAAVKTSFVNELTFAYYNREPETIYEATVAPDNLFNTIPQIINVPQGASFDVTWSDDSNNGLKYCCLSAYIDLNADGDFTDEGELLKVAGTKGAESTTACEGKINVLLPYDAPLGLTHMRIRFDGAWKDNGYNATTKSYDAKAQLNRMCYEVVINITEKSDKAATINVETNNSDWGTVEVWTDETPDGSTGTTWNVSANIPMYLRATKASDDVEFLGWYDQYGRLLTSELEYSMLAREDATYTARFRKALEIDGWQFEYRTEPGSELRVKGALAKGAKPENGKTYYIAADAKQSNGDFVSYYLYDNGSALKTSTSANGNSYLWTCIVNNDGTYSFQNASGKYLANDGSHFLSIGATPAKYAFETANAGTGVALTNVSDGYTGSKWMVTKFDGSAFNKNSVSVNNGSWCNDYIFTEVSTPDVVILTSVRQSGDHDLEIPNTVEILGEQCKVVGFDNNLFNNNKDLWSISLPQTIEFLSEKSLFNHTLTGNGNTQTFDVDIKNNEGWTITMDVVRTGELTGWGSCLIASGSNPAKPDGSNYAEGFQFYLQCTEKGAARDKLIIKTKTQVNDNWYFDDVYQESKFTVVINYNGAQQLSVNVLKADGTNATNHEGKQEPIVFTDCTIQNITQLCTNVQAAITAHVEIDKAAESDPFEGCSNLFGITVANGCTNYRVADGKLYNASDFVLHTLSNAEKADAIRNLGTLIDNTKALMDVIAASVDATGKATEIELTTTKGEDYYIWCNAPQDDDEGDVGRLLDNTPNTFFHSNWESTTAPADGLDHHLTIENVKGIADLKFHYQARSGGGLGDYPKTIKVQGSNNGTDYTDIAIVQPRNANGGTIENGAEWTSEKLGDGNRYTYLRFMVTATTTNKNKDGHIYFHMAEFDLFKLTSTVEVVDEYKELGGITNDEAAEVYDNLVNALYFYNNGGTAGELQAAYDVLKPLYDALNDKKESLQYIKDLTLLIGDTDALIDRISTSVNPVGKATEIALSTTESDNYYIWCNNPHSESHADGKGGVAALLDEDAATYLHTNYDGSTKSKTHDYLQIDNVNPADFYNFKIAGQQRSGASDDYPKTIEIYGSNDNTNWTSISTVTDLPNQSGATWSSEVLTSNAKYAYYKFVVKTHNNHNGTAPLARPWFHMAKFDLFKLTSTVEVKSAYQNIAEITNEEATAAYDLMVSAQYLCNNGGTATELEAILTALQSSYEALYEKINNSVIPEKGKFYTIKNDNYYITGSTTSGGRIALSTTKDADAIYYYDGSHLLSYNTGLYIGLNANDWTFEAVGSADISTVTFVKAANSTPGALNIKCGTRWLHKDNGFVNRCTYNTCGAAHNWIVEEVTSLPVALSTIGENSWATLYAPVALNIPTDVTAYTGALNDNKTWLTLTKVEGGVIPAETAVILEGTKDAGVQYFDVTTTEPTNTEYALKGTVATKVASTNEGTIYTLQQKQKKDENGNVVEYLNSVVFGIYANEDNSVPNLKGFRAYLPISTANPTESIGIRFEGTTDIESSTLNPQPSTQIYDLMGRRVETMTKGGIYIVNGKKVVIR